jgi:hypothetical protein
MDKIEEILNDHCGAIRFIFHNDEGNMRDEYDIICAMKEFGRICFEAARKYHLHNTYEFDHYEDFLKEIEDENI